MKNFLAAFAVILVLCAVTSCQKENIAIHHGDFSYDYNPVYGDSISTVIITYGDTTFINNGTLIIVSDSGIYVGGNFTPIYVGTVVFDNSTNISYQWNGSFWVGNNVVTNITQTYVNIHNTWVQVNVWNTVNNNCGCQTDTTVIVQGDTIVIIHDATKIPVQLALLEDRFLDSTECGLTGLQLLTSGKIYHRWGRGSDNNPTFGSWELLSDLGNGNYRFKSKSEIVASTATFLITNGTPSLPLTALLSPCGGQPGPYLKGWDFQLTPEAPQPAEYTWTPGSWPSFDGDKTNGVLYVARTQAVKDACPMHHTAVGYVLLLKIQPVYRWFQGDSITAGEYQLPN